MPRRTNPPPPPRHAPLARKQRLALAGASLLIPSCSSAAPSWLSPPSPETILSKAVEIGEAGNLQNPDEVSKILGVKFFVSSSHGTASVFAPSDPTLASFIQYSADTAARPISGPLQTFGTLVFKVPDAYGCVRPLVPAVHEGPPPGPQSLHTPPRKRRQSLIL